MERLQKKTTKTPKGAADIHIFFLLYHQLKWTCSNINSSFIRILEYVCTYKHTQTHMIKSIETNFTLYLKQFKKSVILKSGIYQMLFHTVTLMGFSSFGFEPDLKLP